MKVKTRLVCHQGKSYLFVTKGTQRFSDEDINEYFETNKHKEVIEESVGIPISKPVFVVHDHLKKIFLSDIRLGLQFCCKKYGATEAEIVGEARRIAPEINIDLLIRKD